MPDIIITEFMDEAPIDRLRGQFKVHRDDTLWERPDELSSLAANARALIVRNKTQVTAELIANAPSLRAVGRLGVGLDNIDVAACEARGIAVLPAIGANAVSVAEYVLTAALLLTRGSAFFGTYRLTEGEWPRAEMGMGGEIRGKTMGLVGFGSIGQTTADLARAAGFTTIAHDDFLPAGSEAWQTTASVTLPDLLARADVVSLHCPLTPETRGLIGASELAAMKPGAILINTARGGIVDEAALAGALRSGQLGGAALDVFQSEPIDAHSANRFKGLTNLILTPHIAGVTREANTRISALTVENVLRALSAPTP